MAVAFDFQTLSSETEAVLGRAFPGSAISTAEGWQGRVHVKIVSSSFDGLDEEAKQLVVWDVLRSELGPEAQGISLVLVYGLDEI